jgi:type VI secretion system protein ImpC
MTRPRSGEPSELDLVAIACLLPSLFYVVVMFVYPFLYGVYLSLRPAKVPGFSLANYAAFFSVQSCQKAKMYDSESANANARLSTQLSYIMAVSRFAHYLKAMMRDKIGSYMTRGECEAYLNRWIMGYVVDSSSATASMKAKFPLAEARVDVTEIAGKPGAYRAVAFLKPHFQLDELTVSLRLVADLPQPAS